MYEFILYIYIFLLGLIFGSFLNVCIYRMPNEKSIIKSPSSCTACGTRLKPIDLIPVFSYIFLRGKCRYCGEKVSIKYPFVELLTGFIYIALFNRFGLSVDFIATVFLMTILIPVFFIDLKHLIIPNELVLTGLGGGVLLIIYNIFYPVSIYGDRNWWNPLLGMVAGFGFLFIIALLGILIYRTDDALGMGDVKIFAPIGIFLGWKLTIVALVLSIFCGGLMGVILLVLRKKGRKSAIPFGPFIVIGTFITIVFGWRIIDWYLYGL